MFNIDLIYILINQSNQIFKKKNELKFEIIILKSFQLVVIVTSIQFSCETIKSTEYEIKKKKNENKLLILFNF